MTTSKQVYDIAKAHLGHHGSHARAYCGMTGGPYCCAFVTMCMQKSGGAKLFYGGKKCTYCPNAINWCKANLAQVPPYLAMRMDLIFFDWQPNGTPDHIGFVLDKISTDKIRTLEGNTSGGIVAVKTRGGYIQGIFRPHYAPDRKLSKEVLKVDGDFGYQSIYMLQVALNLKPTGILDKGTVKKLQSVCGAVPDGAWGPKTSRLVQSKLCGFKGKALDSDFGPASVKALQKYINSKCFPSTTKPTSSVTKPTAPKPVATAYTGAFPDLVTNSGQRLAYTARDLAYAKGTSEAKYTYPKGKAKALFTKAINKVFPKRSSWSKQCQAGASCDVGAATIIRYSGVDTKVPRGLKEQLDHFKKSSLWKNTGLKKCSLAGDVAMQPSPNAHIWIGLGDGNLAEANHTWKFFEHIKKDNRKINDKPKSAVYRCTKATPISKGDRGTEVVKWQKFLNWAGFNCGAADGDFGDKGVTATKAFQKKVGLDPDGIVGSGTIAKAKVYKK